MFITGERNEMLIVNNLRHRLDSHQENFLVQKYRLYLSRLQKENDIKNSLMGVKHSDPPSKDSSPSLGLHKLMNVTQEEVSNGTYCFSANSSNVDLKAHDGDRKAITSVPVADPRGGLSGDIPDPHKAKSLQISFDHSLGSVDSGQNITSFSPTNPAHYSWCGIPEIQFKQECEPLQLDQISPQPLPGSQHQMQMEYLQPASFISSGPSITEKEVSTSRTEFRPLYDDYGSNDIKHLSPIEAVALLPDQNKSQTPNNQVFDPISASTSSLKTQNACLNGLLANLEFSQRNLNSGLAVPFASLPEDLQQLCWLQGDCYSMNFGLQDFECTDYDDPEPVTDIPFHLFDAPRFDHEHLFDPTECFAIDQGLFA